MPGYELDYVALVARDVEAVCRFLGDSLGLSRNDVAFADRAIPSFGIGQSVLLICELDDPWLDEPRSAGVHHLALAATDPAAVAAAHDLTVTGEGTGPGAKRFVSIDRKATVGIRTRFTEPLDVCATDDCADKSVYKIDHLGIATNDIDATTRVFADSLGCPIDSTETDVEVRNVTESFISDKYGALYHSRPVEIVGGVRAAFITIGDCELEVIMDYDPTLKPREQLGEAQGNTKGDQSAIAKFVARHGPGLAHIAFATRDIDTTLRKLADDGWRMIDAEGRPGGRGSLIGFVHPSNFGGGLLMHFVEPQCDGGYAAKKF